MTGILFEIGLHEIVIFISLPAFGERTHFNKRKSSWGGGGERGGGQAQSRLNTTGAAPLPTSNQSRERRHPCAVAPWDQAEPQRNTCPPPAQGGHSSRSLRRKRGIALNRHHPSSGRNRLPVSNIKQVVSTYFSRKGKTNAEHDSC